VCTNFPKYDWLTGIVDGAGKVVVKGEQTKHGRGDVQAPADGVVSVKLSTKVSGLDEWKKAGWLVLYEPDLKRYLGPTISAAAVCLLHLPKSKPATGKKPATKAAAKKKPKAAKSKKTAKK
jgi:hypothetical protein